MSTVFQLKLIKSIGNVALFIIGIIMHLADQNSSGELDTCQFTLTYNLYKYL